MHFWNFMDGDGDGERVLRIDGPIDEDSFWGDEITPKSFRDELEASNGPLTVWINSPGGNVIAASEIYTMLMDYKGSVNVKIDGIAASAASVIAMAGEHVGMSPTSIMMIHNPMTVATGDAKEMKHAIDVLNEVKESIINAYEIKTGLSRDKIADLMDKETWMNAKKAAELGFADEVMYENKTDETDDAWSMQGVIDVEHKAITNMVKRYKPVIDETPTEPEKPKGVDMRKARARLALLGKRYK